jgi:hypothetical protein
MKSGVPDVVGLASASREVLTAVQRCSSRWIMVRPKAAASMGVRHHCGGFAAAVARGLRLRHDHGSEYMSDHFQKEISFLGKKRSR